MPLVEVTSGDGRVLVAKSVDGSSYLMLDFSMIFDDVWQLLTGFEEFCYVYICVYIYIYLYMYCVQYVLLVLFWWSVARIWIYWWIFKGEWSCLGGAQVIQKQMFFSTRDIQLHGWINGCQQVPRTTPPFIVLENLVSWPKEKGTQESIKNHKNEQDITRWDHIMMNLWSGYEDFYAYTEVFPWMLGK